MQRRDASAGHTEDISYSVHGEHVRYRVNGDLLSRVLAHMLRLDNILQRWQKP